MLRLLLQETVHMTWFNFEDAFGSVKHGLIGYTLKETLKPFPCVQLDKHITLRKEFQQNLGSERN